jgi:hypothetical protein
MKHQPTDKELKTLAITVRLLESLNEDKPAQERVLQYLFDRYCADMFIPIRRNRAALAEGEGKE